MRQIKFRGQDLDGKMRYGFYAEHQDEPYIVEKNQSWHEVQSDTVAQLVGYDSNGADVYEGDTLIDEKGFIYKAFLQPSVEWEKEKERKDFFGWSGMPLTFTKQFTKLNLKEASGRAAD